jgi:hypothetical protein
MNLRVLPASWRQRNPREALPTRRRVRVYRASQELERSAGFTDQTAGTPAPQTRVGKSRCPFANQPSCGQSPCPYRRSRRDGKHIRRRQHLAGPAVRGSWSQCMRKRKRDLHRPEPRASPVNNVVITFEYLRVAGRRRTSYRVHVFSSNTRGCPEGKQKLAATLVAADRGSTRTETGG